MFLTPKKRYSHLELNFDTDWNWDRCCKTMGILSPIFAIVLAPIVSDISDKRDKEYIKDCNTTETEDLVIIGFHAVTKWFLLMLTSALSLYAMLIFQWFGEAWNTKGAIQPSNSIKLEL